MIERQSAMVEPALGEWNLLASLPEVEIRLRWRGQDWSLILGLLRPRLGLLRYAPALALREGEAWVSLSEPFQYRGGERLDRLAAKALCRAGWHRPRIDPAALSTLLHLQGLARRVEFIIDSSSLGDGVAHWLGSWFADRCDLVVTDVSLRELQDQHEPAKLTAREAVSGSRHADGVFRLDGEAGKTLKARSFYLGARRFLEFPGLSRLLWRELELETTALLLSRGISKGDKISESDTAILRSARKSIQERVRGLERFFVVSDTALARRAATELPQGAVIAGQVPDLAPGRVYHPCEWWPGPDQGRSVHQTHPLRLVWELLALADSVEFGRPGQDPLLSVCAFSREMWPSDYQAPWLLFRWKEEFLAQVAPAPPLAPEPEDLEEPARAEAPGLQERLYPEDEEAGDWSEFGGAFEVGARQLLNLLHELAQLEGENPVALKGPLTSVRRDTQLSYLLLAEALGLLRLERKTLQVRPGPRQPLLRRIWRAGDVEGVSRLLRAYLPYRQVLEEPPSGGERQPHRVRAMLAVARVLGDLVPQQDAWLRGAANPVMADIRERLLEALDESAPRGSMPMRALFEEVLLRRLEVSPARAARAWDRMVGAGVFRGLDFRRGGSSSGRFGAEVLRIDAGGWRVETVDVEAFQEYRDVVRAEP